MLLNCRLDTTQMLPERKVKQNQKDGWDIFAFRNNKTNGQVYNESKFRHWQGITLKNDSLENKKATIYKCSTTFYLFQELIICFHYTSGQPKFSIPLTVKCYYSEITSIVDIATITQIITPFFSLHTEFKPSGNIISRTWQKMGWDVHLEMTIWIN